VARVERQGPDRQAVVRDVELLPVLSVVGAPIRTVLRADIDGVGMLRVHGDRPDGGRGRKTARRELPMIVAGSNAIETGFDGPARSGFASQADVHVGSAIHRHGPLLHLASSI